MRLCKSNCSSSDESATLEKEKLEMKENKLNTNKFLASFWYSYLLCIVQPWLLIISVDIRNNLFSFVFNYSDFAIVYSKHSCWFFLPSSAPVGQYQSSWTGIAWQLCTTMYDYVWLCMTMYDYVWLCMTMYEYVWLFMNMYEKIQNEEISPNRRASK